MKNVVTSTLWIIAAIIGMTEAAILMGISRDAIFVSGVVILSVMFNRSTLEEKFFTGDRNKFNRFARGINGFLTIPFSRFF